MAADLHIHIRTPEVTDEVMHGFFRNTLGSVYFGGFYASGLTWEEEHERYWTVIERTPAVWVGSVSWLKAALADELGAFDGNGEQFTPGPVVAIQQLFDTPDECRTIDDEFIEQVRNAYDAPNKANPYYKHDSRDEVIAFLEQYKGERCFTISW